MKDCSSREPPLGPGAKKDGCFRRLEGLSCRVVYEGQLTETLEVGIKVRQGCLLSNFLYFLADHEMCHKPVKKWDPVNPVVPVGRFGLSAGRSSASVKQPLADAEQ